MSERMVRAPHSCKTPGLGYNRGSVWQCDCGRRWKYVAPGNPLYEGWRKTLLSALGWKHH